MRRSRRKDPDVGWTPHDIATAASLWARHCTDVYGDDELPKNGLRIRVLQLIAQIINRGVATVQHRYYSCGPTFDQGPIARRKGRGLTAIPERLLTDRDARRAALDERDQTATFFGDPPKGYSALDQRR